MQMISFSSMELRYRYERGAKQKTKLTERVWYYFLFSLQVPGNKMSEENLGTILGPNLLHNENKVFTSYHQCGVC